MAELIARSLRVGVLEGEHAQALSIEDSLRFPFGSIVFDHFLCSLASNISSAKSQARGLVIVAFRRSPDFYLDFLKSRGFDSSSFDKWLVFLDCFSDPLGWKARIRGINSNSDNGQIFVVRDVWDISKLQNSIINIGKGIVGHGKSWFAVVIDSVSEVLRHVKLPSLAGLLNDLRSHEQISCIFWLVNRDLHEPRTNLALKYISTMVGILDSTQPSSSQQFSSPSAKQNNSRGKFQVRIKRRNGRVKILYEEFHMEQGKMNFAAFSSENVVINQSIISKVQFNLQLTEKEREERAKVVLPFEHQGNGKNIHIYDGRQPAVENILVAASDVGAGEIHYIRDSDDERPDSDEDPDNDLDI